MHVDTKALKTQYRELYTEIQEIFFRHDLMGINFGDNTDEYDPEVCTILPRLKTATDKDDVTAIVREEFERWFNTEVTSKEMNAAYSKMAVEVWEAWIKFSRPLA